MHIAPILSPHSLWTGCLLGKARSEHDVCGPAHDTVLTNRQTEKLNFDTAESDPLETVNSLVEKTLDPLVHKGYISLANRKYLVVSKPRLGKFYLLPKIHKRLENVPGRPVISNCGTAIERISEFLDFHIQPLVCNVPSVIKDTSDFLQKLESLGHIPSTAILCTIDVIGLYPHIPHGEGLEALLGAFNRAEWELPVEDLVSLARLVLENNYFEFDEKIFRQKLGTAIGTKFAPGFANIFMGHMEEKFLETCELKPWVWWRFLDDIFVIWLHSEELNY